ncbi:MAG: hypothetical protein JW995_06380 [Melioribacteraceae bacterium]|nr:hypothetical protein [Melioribacteraceae bacterium]
MCANFTSTEKSGERNINGSNKNSASVRVPASIIILGDHTHYNDGIILSCAVDRFAEAEIIKRQDQEINFVFGDCEFEYKTSIESVSEIDIKCGDISFGPLLRLLKERKLLNCGFDCRINSNIPSVLGLGRISAHQIAFISAFNKLMRLKLADDEIIDISREAEISFIGPICNKTHHQTILKAKSGSFILNDLRDNSVKLIKIGTDDYNIVICDTGKVIDKISEVCNERISECKVGVDGLRLYIWGIKNLRDVNPDFLKRHYHMIPRKVYNRVFYNVNERIRVEQAIEMLRKKEPDGFRRIVKESHISLRNDYEIGSEKLDYILNIAADFKSVIASKMISCSPIEGVFNIVKASEVQKFSDTIRKEYNKRYGEELITHTLSFSDGFNFL